MGSGPAAGANFFMNNTNQLIRTRRTHFLTFTLALGCIAVSAPIGRKPQLSRQLQPRPPLKAVSLVKVAETMDAASYTYVLVDTGFTNKFWAAAPRFTVKVRDAVVVAAAIAMPNYHSKTLNRDFDVVYFTNNVTVSGKVTAQVKSPRNSRAIIHPLVALLQTGFCFTKIKQADGVNASRIFSLTKSNSKANGSPFERRRGQIQRRGHGEELAAHPRMDRAPLAIMISPSPPRPKRNSGDTVLVTGSLSTDRDFGGGYRYTVIVEDAKVTVE